MGHWGKNGSTYIIDWNKVRTYVVPDSLSEFKVGLLLDSYTGALDGSMKMSLG